MIVSFLIPTRGRLQMLLESIQSVKNTASPDVQLEFLVRIDDNDYETLTARDRIPGEIVVGPRWYGYDSIPAFINELAKKSHGDWLIAWSDDTFMMTRHWDKLLPPIDPVNRAWIHWLFLPGSWTWALPIMTRKLYELWGCYVHAAPADSAIFQIWQATGKPLQKKEEFKIKVEHRRNEANIFALAIRPDDRVPSPTDPNMKNGDELLRLLRDAL